MKYSELPKKLNNIYKKVEEKREMRVKEIDGNIQNSFQISTVNKGEKL